MNDRISFVGFMGCGKTTIGSLVAKRINYDFLDVDEVITQNIGMPISDIFKRYGEKYFRSIEKNTISNVMKMKRVVISTGGGAVMNPQSLGLLLDQSEVFYLEASTDILWERLKSCGSRPMLYDSNPRARMEELYKTRLPVYRKAHRTICTDGKSEERIVQEVLKYLE